MSDKIDRKLIDSTYIYSFIEDFVLSNCFEFEFTKKKGIEKN